MSQQRHLDCGICSDLRAIVLTLIDVGIDYQVCECWLPVRVSGNNVVYSLPSASSVQKYSKKWWREKVMERMINSITQVSKRHSPYVVSVHPFAREKHRRRCVGYDEGLID